MRWESRDGEAGQYGGIGGTLRRDVEAGWPDGTVRWDIEAGQCGWTVRWDVEAGH